MGAANFDGARAYALHRLSCELEPELIYHCVEHTRDEVMVIVAHYAAEYGIHDDDLLLLKTAACFHDLGFIECREGHEKASARIAREVLPGFGYSQAQIDTIADIIMATQLPQSPRSLMEQIIADADLDVFGSDDFLTRNSALRAEMEAFGMSVDDAQWYEQQIRFARSHQYFTDAARRKNDVRKTQNIALLERRLVKSRAQTS